MKLFDMLKKQKTRFITKELISLSSLAQVPTKDYFKDNNQILLLINLYKKEYLEILIKEKVLTSNELKSAELHNKLNMIHTLIEQNTLDDELFEKVIFDEEDKVKALVKIRKFAIYNERIKELEEEVIWRIIALKEILKKTFLNRQKKISIINEINNLTNIFVILMNQKETLKLCLNNYSLKCFDITKEKEEEKEEIIISKRKEELNAYQKQAFGKVVYELNELNDMAKVEIALEDYVYNYKEPTTLYLCDAILVLRDSIELDFINKANNFAKTYSKLLELENRCKIFYEFGKNIIDKDDIKKVYKLKFEILTCWENCKLIEPFVNTTTPKLELETYEEIIYALISAINNNKESGLSSIQTEFKNYTFTILRLLKKELQTNGKYDALEILKNKYKLNLLLAFSYPINIDVIKEIYKNIYVKKSDYPEVNFYEPEFRWKDNLSLETINELKLMQNQKQDLGLYLFLKKYFQTNANNNIYYYLPEGLQKIGYLMGLSEGKLKNPKQMKEIMKFVKYIRQNMQGKIVILPKTLEIVLGDIVGDTELKELRLNSDLKIFNFNFASVANVERIEIPANVIPLKYNFHKQINSSLKEIHFLDFDKSFFYENIENLRTVLSPYIKATPLEEYQIMDGTTKKEIIYELTIDRIIIDFNKNWITLPKSACKIIEDDFSDFFGEYVLIRYINDLITEKISKYQDIEKRKLTKT